MPLENDTRNVYSDESSRYVILTLFLQMLLENLKKEEEEEIIIYLGPFSLSLSLLVSTKTNESISLNFFLVQREMKRQSIHEDKD